MTQYNMLWQQIDCQDLFRCTDFDKNILVSYGIEKIRRGKRENLYSDLDPRGEYKNNWIIGSLRANIKGTFYTLRRFCGNIFMQKDLLATFLVFDRDYFPGRSSIIFFYAVSSVVSDLFTFSGVTRSPVPILCKENWKLVPRQKGAKPHPG